jgi:hypothetical protein
VHGSGKRRSFAGYRGAIQATVAAKTWVQGRAEIVAEMEIVLAGETTQRERAEGRQSSNTPKRRAGNRGN